MPKPAICPRYPMLTLHSAEELPRDKPGFAHFNVLACVCYLIAYSATDRHGSHSDLPISRSGGSADWLQSFSNLPRCRATAWPGYSLRSIVLAAITVTICQAGPLDGRVIVLDPGHARPGSVDSVRVWPCAVYPGRGVGQQVRASSIGL